MPSHRLLNSEKSLCSLLAFVGVVILILCMIDPATNVLAPKCPIHLLTGLSCPGCGLQRAIHALYHGRVAEALSYNYFLLISIPYAMAITIAWVMKKTGHSGWVTDEIEHPRYGWTFVILFFAWWIVRNIYHI